VNTILKDISLSAIVAGFVATVISYAGPLVIIFQVAQSADLPFEILTSWIWAISIGSGVLGIYLSWRFRMPIIIAWNAPGSALLITLLPEVSIGEAVGAYMVSSLLILLIGLSGAFDRLVKKLPGAISAGMLAGILFNFGLGLFVSLEESFTLVFIMLSTYVIFKRFSPRYAVMAVLFAGVITALLVGEMELSKLNFNIAKPVWINPEFSIQAIINIALPLVVVAITGQFIPGMAVLHNDGFNAQASPFLTTTGVGSLLLAPFACHGLTLAAITAAICTGRESHEDPSRRYIAGMAGGLFYLLLGLFGAAIVAVFTAFPAALIAALAGLALLGAIASSLSSSMREAKVREAALITFLVTASGMSLYGLSSAFWGLFFGIASHLIIFWGKPD
jgi:benzoate membrane transport protein